MASDVPVKDLRDLRPLANWRDELGLDRLRADLINGDLDAWWQHYTTGDYRRIPRAHWQQKRAVEHALGWGWSIGGGLFSPDVPFRSCAIHAARRVKRAGGRKPIYDWPAAYDEMRTYVRENGQPKKAAPLVRHIENWFAERNQYPSSSKVREHVGNIFARNSVRVENRAMLLRDERCCQAHCLDGLIY
jgi:hypothetical protein